MFDYFALLPAAALRREFDGNLYAYVGHKVTGDGVKECPARMIRADDAVISHGVARVRIGSMGSAIAQRLALPWGIECTQRADDS